MEKLQHELGPLFVLLGITVYSNLAWINLSKDNPTCKVQKVFVRRTGEVAVNFRKPSSGFLVHILPFSSSSCL